VIKRGEATGREATGKRRRDRLTEEESKERERDIKYE
jgi:hypothetical protein